MVKNAVEQIRNPISTIIKKTTTKTEQNKSSQTQKNTKGKVNVYLNENSCGLIGAVLHGFEFGHADLEVDGKIYSYGRYDTNEIWGSFGSKGAGVLVVAQGRQITDAEHRKKGRTIYTYELNMNEEQGKRLRDYLDMSINEGYAWKEDKKKGLMKYKFYSDNKYHEYKLLSRNCTTYTIDALKAAYGDELPRIFDRAIISPSQLNTALRMSRWHEESIIKAIEIQ